MGQADVSQITRKKIRNFLLMLYEIGSRPKTVRRRLSVVKSFCIWLHKEGLLDARLLWSIKGPRLRDELPDVPSETDMKRLLEGKIPGPCPERDRALLELLYGSGLRASESIGINLSDFKEDRVLVIRGKGSKERFVAFGECAKRAIEAWVPARKKLLKKFNLQTDALFFSVGPRQSAERLEVRSVSRIVKRVAEANGLPLFNPHALRHACATHMHDHGAPLQAVAIQLGHENLETATIYTRVSTGRMLDVYRTAHPHAH
jgi:integrase/recombinase XerC